jgi:hypothetical protein
VVNRSVLELVVGGLPYPHGANGEWRYRHAVRPEGTTALDHQAVADFLAYEKAHGRVVTVTAQPELSDWESWLTPTRRPHPGAFATQCCTHVYPDGCSSMLVCHGAPAIVAPQILEQGVLRSAVAATGHGPDELAGWSTWGDPPDYFEHVMLANGRCTAPEAVAVSRVIGGDLVPSDLSAGYRPAVRFYFAWEALASRHDAVFDGVHAVKIHTELSLDDALVAVVVHASEHGVIAAAASRPVRDRLVVLGLTKPRPDQWATAALEAAMKLV